MKLKELESHLQQVDEFESPKILLGESGTVKFFHDDHLEFEDYCGGFPF